MGRGDLVPRIITRFGVHLRRPEQDRFVPAAPVNLSETGACIRTVRPPAPGQVVALRITLGENEEPFETNGRVVWVRPDHLGNAAYCGIGFVAVSEEHVRRIRRYVENGAQALLDFLAEFPLFAQFSVDDCRSLLRIITLRELEKNEILYKEGTEDYELQGLFIVQAGLLRILKGRLPGRERQLAVVSAGEIFGETTLICDQPHSATVRAVNPSRLIQLNKVGFQLLREQEPALALKIMDVIARTLVKRLGRTTHRMLSPVLT